MPTIAEADIPCPDCGVTIKATARSCACGWRTGGRALAGPDHARIEADRVRSIARAFEEYTGPRACRARHCASNIFPARAEPGSDLCAACKAREDSGQEVRRLGRPQWSRNAGEIAQEGLR